jgi:hypothetical protein
MIEFYRPADCENCEIIEEALTEMVIAHKVIVVEPGQPPKGLPAGTPLPALVDNGQIFTGSAELAAHLKELEKVVADWPRFQSDACYIDDDGEVC